MICYSHAYKDTEREHQRGQAHKQAAIENVQRIRIKIRKSTIAIINYCLISGQIGHFFGARKTRTTWPVHLKNEHDHPITEKVFLNEPESPAHDWYGDIYFTQ